MITAFEGVDVEIETNQLSFESRTKLKETFFARDYDGNFRFVADEDALGIDDTIIAGWFTAVPDESVETP